MDRFTTELASATESGRDLTGFWYFCIALCVFFSLIALGSSVLQPPSAFKAAGTSKIFWMLMNFLSLILVFPSLIFVTYYLFRVRPKLFTRTNRKSKLDAPIIIGSPGSQAIVGLDSVIGRPNAPVQVPPGCPTCHGQKTRPCTCSGGFIHEPDGSVTQHAYCMGTGIVTCSTCNGFG